MDTRQAQRFLGTLHKEGDEFEVAFIQPGGKVARVRRTMSEDLAPLMDEMERAEAAGFNVYASVLSTADQETRTYSKVWVDMDDLGAPWPFGADDRWEGAAWPKANTLVKTSTEDDGSFRWQAIWHLKTPLPEDEGSRLVRRLAAQSGGDQSVFDPRRVLRVPGVFNVKRGSMARLIDTEDGAIAPSAFNLPDDTLVQQLLEATVSNPAHVLGEWLGGTDEGDRSRKAYVAARFLKSCGVGWNDAAAILKLGALRSAPVFDDRELVHCINSAYHRKE
jgi:hypothetical protein